MENGRRDREQGAESDEDDDHQQNTSDTGRERSWAVNKPVIIQSNGYGVKCISLFGFQGQAGQQTSGIAERMRGPRPSQGGSLQGETHRCRKLAGPISLSLGLSLGEKNDCWPLNSVYLSM